MKYRFSFLHRRKKKTEVDPRTLSQLRWSSLLLYVKTGSHQLLSQSGPSLMCQDYLLCFSKGTKEFNRYTCRSKKLLSLLGHLNTFNLKVLKTLKSS